MFTRKKRAVVLGAGPTGLLAAQAAEDRGWEVQVFSAPGEDGNPKKSELHGCQYLHQWIPGLGLPTTGTPVSYLLEGTREDYRRKVYGNGWDGNVSPDEYGPEKGHQAWDLRLAYNTLWEKWESRVTSLEITPPIAARAFLTKGQIVFSSVPAPALCQYPEEHKFISQAIWAMGSRVHLRVDPDHGAAPGFVGSNMPYRAADFTVLCNGNEAPRWYRAATVFGQSTLEWPGGVKPPITGVAAVSKPLSTDCDCNAGPRWHRVGRYGQWTKGVLAHTAYQKVWSL